MRQSLELIACGCAVCAKYAAGDCSLFWSMPLLMCKSPLDLNSRIAEVRGRHRVQPLLDSDGSAGARPAGEKEKGYDLRALYIAHGRPAWNLEVRDSGKVIISIGARVARTDSESCRQAMPALLASRM
jgi:hypothetical protein